ncbi:integrin alpha-5-like [Rhinoraja longicauda]
MMHAWNQCQHKLVECQLCSHTDSAVGELCALPAVFHVGHPVPGLAFTCQRAFKEPVNTRSKPEAARPYVLIGAPKANTSQPNVTESGAVYSCAWGQNDTECQQVPFDLTGNRLYNETEAMELKSNQWFGATIRSHNHTILACAPRYTWRQNLQNNELVGTCYLSIGNVSHVVEYAPCRTSWHSPSGRGFCQAGFSADLTEGHFGVLPD